MGTHDPKKTTKAIIPWFVFALFVAFFYNGYIFLTTHGNEHPLVNSLFTVIIVLFAFFILHQKDQLKEDKGKQFHLRNSLC